ncbi:site-specific integrase [Streptomyces sp. ISL-10]|uniref:tyrosine-type recombinase/integrase n=1 Tax=Streptomyces sp. ISL-10 TaxID=2819172 RepID=UPI001BE6B249|nr:site-specific integrase [Streptomyces sp. ISL-10]MBT2367154.1 site-specific integrase [Streptomyces sp. ISL-10]
MLTYDVEIWSIRERKGRAKPFELRWRTENQPHSKSYRTKAQADGRRAQLLRALNKREQFDVDTGLPATELAALNSPTWYEHALAYALMKWPKAAAKHRAGISEGLAVATPAFVTSDRGAPDSKTLRTALHSWAFRMARTPDGRWASRSEVEAMPEEIAQALTWLSKHSIKVREAAKPEHLRKALEALSIKVNGEPAADNTFLRKRSVLSNALKYAVERGHLDFHPLPRVDWAPPATDDEVDFRYVPNPRQARGLIGAVRAQGPRGEHLEAFFGCFYYAAMRPGEIASLKDTDCVLPSEVDADAWGELILEESRPEVGAGWTDDGSSYEQRGLKRRARGATRTVPIPPVLVKMIRDHREKYGIADDGRLFRAARGGRVRSTEYSELWDAARGIALTPAEARTPLADVPYSLRHAGISLWIKAGVDPAEVARRAGHSLAVLYRFYARLLRGQQGRANELIAKELER